MSHRAEGPPSAEVPRALTYLWWSFVVEDDGLSVLLRLSSSQEGPKMAVESNLRCKRSSTLRTREGIGRGSRFSA